MEPVVEQCVGCGKIRIEDNTCTAYAIPSSKWRIGRCPLATHIKDAVAEKKFIDPLKQSKKSRRSIT